MCFMYPLYFAYMFDHYIKQIVLAKNNRMCISIFQLSGPKQIMVELCWAELLCCP